MGQPPIHKSSSLKPETLLRVEDLAKSYPAFKLHDVSFSVEAGTITGFIGRNGAGKSTTLKCLEGAVHPDGGTIEYFGRLYRGNEDTIKEQVGFELNSADFYRTKRLSLIANVTSKFYANWSDDAYARYCKLFNLDQKKRIMDLSQGMRVKFALALALSHNARLLILGEPTSGLDPASREEVLDILLKLARNENVGVLFSTHITSDLEKCASNILYVDNGNIIGKGSLSEFKDHYRVASLDAANAASFGIAGFNDPSAQLCVLAAGLVVFIVCNVAACKLSARSFTHFDA